LPHDRASRARRCQGAWRALALATAVLGAACAARQSPSLNDRLITQAPPGAELPELLPGWPAPVADASPFAELAKPPAIEPKTSDLPSIETTDPQLAAALEALGRSPSADAHRRVGAAYRRVHVYDQAYRHLSQAVALAPDDVRNREALARLWRDWGVAEEALPEAYRAVHLAPDAVWAQNTLGTVLVSLGEFRAAVSVFERVTALEPTTAWTWSNLCYASLMAGQGAQARSQCEQALVFDPGFGPARNNLGLVLAAEGDLDGAEREFRAGGAAAADFNMGVVHMARHEFALARERFLAALAADPALGQARRMADDAERLERDRQAVQVGRRD